MKLLDGKVAIITGGSRGIGRAIARKYAEEGASVAITARNINEEVQAFVTELETLGVKAKAYTSDASQFDAAHELVKEVVAEFGRIDILINNAGVTQDTLMMRMTEEQWDTVININLKGAFNLIHAVTPFMMKQRSGNIINMSSVVGISGNAGQANYAASKAGMIGLTKSIAKEMGSRGIRANTIAPGFIATDMTHALSDEVRKQWEAQIPQRRAGSPEDVAGVAVFLASDLASYVTWRYEYVSPMVIYEDNHLLIVSKRPGEIVQGDKTGDIPMVESLKLYLKEKYNKPGNVFLGLVHRLDRPVGGLVIFAKTSKALSRMTQMFAKGEVQKSYLAIVSDKPQEAQARLTHYLVRNEKQNKSYAYHQERANSKRAELSYRLISNGEHYHLVEVDLHTGRHHQIRCQLSAIGCPIKGDLKYGAKRSNPDGSISLLSYRLRFRHPVSGVDLDIKAPLPNERIWRELGQSLED